jgi:hypothetical protein
MRNFTTDGIITIKKPMGGGKGKNTVQKKAST